MNRRQFLSALGMSGLADHALGGLKFWPEQGWTNPCLANLPEHVTQHPLMQTGFGFFRGFASSREKFFSQIAKTWLINY